MTSYELVHVTARRFVASDSIDYSELLALEHAVIFYEQPDTETIWDALQDSEITEGFGVFIMEVLAFTFEAISEQGLLSELMTAVEVGYYHLEQDIEVLVQLARKHLQPQDVTAPDVCLFTLVYECNVELEDAIDFSATLLGELDFTRLVVLGEDHV